MQCLNGRVLIFGGGTRMVLTLLTSLALISAVAKGQEDKAASKTADEAKSAQPSSPPPKPTPQMEAVLNALKELDPKPIPTLSAEEARKQPTPADAVKSLLKKRGKSTDPQPVGDVKNTKIELEGRKLDARIYTPKGEGPFPVILYIHGGGWVIADLDTYDASARALTNEADAVVVSIHYRQAPENKFPSAHQDAYDSYNWVLENAKELGGDPKRVAVVGESAGGNLAANVSRMAKKEGKPLPVHQVLVYPIAGTDTNTPSYQQNAEAKPLNKETMKWFFEKYLSKKDDYEDPKIALVQADDLKGLPPTTIINAEIDPLRSEGEKLAQQLEKAGVKVTQKTYAGVTHEFFGMAPVLDEAKEAQQLVGKELQAAFKE